MTIADLIKETIESSKERIKNPVIGAFICSFIIYNWKAIAYLLFSNESIEYKLIIIQTWYWTVWTLLTPLIMVAIYTFGLPRLMIKINTLLKPVNHKRVEDIYSDKIFTTSQKKLLAEKEYELLNIQNGNKRLEELESQIKELNESHEQIRQTDKLTIENLSTSLRESNEMVQDLTSKVRRQQADLTSEMRLTEERNGVIHSNTLIQLLKETSTDENGFITGASEDRINFLIRGGFAKASREGFSLTAKGKEVWDDLNDR